MRPTICYPSVAFGDSSPKGEPFIGYSYSYSDTFTVVVVPG